MFLTIRGGPEQDLGQADIMLAALAAGGGGATFSPIQLQTLLFLVDQELAGDIVGPHFDFRPYDYGPYDQAVFEVADNLAADGMVCIDRSGPYRRFGLAEAGLETGRAIARRMPRVAARYLIKASRWVLSLGFWDLVSAICRNYPEMTVDGDIRQVALRRPAARHRRMHPFLRGMASVIGNPGTGSEPRAERTANERDSAVTESDWRAVGDDLRFAIERVAAVRDR